MGVRAVVTGCDVRDELGAYVLGALDADEAGVARAPARLPGLRAEHDALAGCRRC